METTQSSVMMKLWRLNDNRFDAARIAGLQAAANQTLDEAVEFA